MKILEGKTKLDKTFEVSLLLKVLDGLLEMISGIIFVFIRPESLTRLVTSVTRHELIQDPHDLVANHLLHAAQNLSPATALFGALYLITHGLAKIGLVAGIMLNKLWAYKALIIFTAGFMIYQAYRIYFTHSVGLILLTLFDGLVVYLTAVEYRKKRASLLSTPD